MNQEELSSAPARELVVPHVPIVEGKDAGNHPLSLRLYTPLEPVNTLELAVAAAIQDESDRVMTPIGAVLLPGHLVGDEDTSRVVMDDITVVPKEQGVALASAVPLIVYDKPEESHADTAEFDFGRFPTTNDIDDSIDNEAKSTEMVLALPAESLIAKTISAMGNGAPNLVGDEIYNNLSFVRREWCEKDTRFVQLLPYIVFYKKVNGLYKVFVYQRGKGVGEERLAMGCSIGVGGHINPHDFLTYQTTKRKLSKEDLGDGLDMLENAWQIEPTGRVLAEGFWTGIVQNVIREGSEEVTITDRGTGIARDVEFGDFLEQEAENAGLTPEMWLYERTAFFLDYQAGDVEKVHLAMFIGIEVPDTFEIETNEEELLDVGFLRVGQLVDPAQTASPTPLECWSRSIIDALSATLAFAETHPDVNGFGSSFVRKVMVQDGIHPANAEEIAKIPPADRWKIGTISQIFGQALRFYAMNVFIRA